MQDCYFLFDHRKKLRVENQKQGFLAGAVGKAHNSCSQGCRFKPRAECKEIKSLNSNSLSFMPFLLFIPKMQNSKK